MKRLGLCRQNVRRQNQFANWYYPAHSHGSKGASDVAIVSPTLAEQIKNFTNTLATVVE